MANRERNKSANSRAARLDSELRANLKKRKDQARARAHAASGGDVAADADKPAHGDAGE